MSTPHPLPLPLHERLQIVYHRLDELPPPASAQEALTQLNTTLDAVEDEYSGVPRDPNPGLKFDGRMYPPRDDYINRQPDGGLEAVTKGNIIKIGPTGETTILSRRSEEVVYYRPAADPVSAPERSVSGRIADLKHRLAQTAPEPMPEQGPVPPREHPFPGPDMDPGVGVEGPSPLS
ncbi:conserved hypothetical protein [Frankia canadensis]|uniref:Uncharacterized protein n=1 Tax=Frankia canadensis TaxID=1836972 RepID=A0A2I2KQU7_9ACTN|nr:hypothetical protein [Frankia canadensis]SNQ48029.1 conserved hypothetical protein [Frankia canadensis]SOU55319.1 conserved hypothetical protein [Frankia canadensis]